MPDRKLCSDYLCKARAPFAGLPMNHQMKPSPYNPGRLVCAWCGLGESAIKGAANQAVMRPGNNESQAEERAERDEAYEQEIP